MEFLKVAEEFHRLEESLKSYLADSQADRHNSQHANMSKYNNLKLWMAPERESTPHVCISLGISEAIYKIDGGERLSGGLGSDERYIRRWIDKPSIQSDLKNFWDNAKKRLIPVVQEQD